MKKFVELWYNALKTYDAGNYTLIPGSWNKSMAWFDDLAGIPHQHPARKYAILLTQFCVRSSLAELVWFVIFGRDCPIFAAASMLSIVMGLLAIAHLRFTKTTFIAGIVADMQQIIPSLIRFHALGYTMYALLASSAIYIPLYSFALMGNVTGRTGGVVTWAICAVLSIWKPLVATPMVTGPRYFIIPSTRFLMIDGWLLHVTCKLLYNAHFEAVRSSATVPL